MKKDIVIEYDNFEKNISQQEICDLLDSASYGYIGDYNFTGTEDDFRRYQIHTAIYKAIKIISKLDKETFEELN